MESSPQKQSANGQLGPERPKQTFLRRVGAAVDTGLMSFFGSIARFVAVRPYTVIVTCIVVALILGAGIARIKVNQNAEELYTPQGSQAFQDRDYVESLYGYESLQLKVYITSPGKSNETVLTEGSILAHLDVYNIIANTVAYYEGSSYTYESPQVCYRPGGPSTPCDKWSVLDYWSYNASAIQSDPDIFTTVSNTSAVDSLGHSLSPSAVMGDISRNASGYIVSANAFQMVMVLQNNKGGSGSSKVDKVVEAWQKAVVAAVKAYQNSLVQVYIFSDWEENDTSSKAITSDISLLIFGYFLLFFFGLLILSKLHIVESRSYMAALNVVSVVLAVLGSYGLCCLVGVQFSLVVQVLALLLLGLGTDDMLVTMAAHDETGLEMPNASVVDRVVATVSRARRGVIVAALTNFVAFCTGISSELPALRDFMIYAAVGVILVLIFQSTFYVACLTLDMRRQRANKMDQLCCLTAKSGPSDGCFGTVYDPEKLGPVHTLIGVYLPNVILHPFGKVGILALTLFFLVMGIIGCTKVEESFDVEWFIPSGTYIESCYQVRSQYFTSAAGKGAIPVGAYTKNPSSPPLDYFNYQTELKALTDNLKVNPYVSTTPPLDSWYESYILWLQSSGSGHASQLNTAGQPTTSADFYTWLHQFLNTTDGARFKSNIIFSNTSANVIVSSRYTFITVNLVDSPMQVSAMRSIRATTESSAPSLEAFAYAFPFLFFEGYAVIGRDTVLAVAIAGAVVFIIMLLLLADLAMSIMVGCMVVLVDIELVGFLHWAGLSFNSVTSINLLLAIGLAVDYSAFIAFAFMTKVGTRQERARLALRHLGVAVFYGGITIFLCILPMAFAKSFIFQTFFKMFSMIVVLGLFHGLLTLPVLLSFFGSPPFQSAYDRHEQLQAEEKSEGLPQGDPTPDGIENGNEMAAPQAQGMGVSTV